MVFDAGCRKSLCGQRRMVKIGSLPPNSLIQLMTWKGYLSCMFPWSKPLLTWSIFYITRTWCVYAFYSAKGTSSSCCWSTCLWPILISFFAMLYGTDRGLCFSGSFHLQRPLFQSDNPYHLGLSYKSFCNQLEAYLEHATFTWQTQVRYLCIFNLFLNVIYWALSI